MTNSGIGTVKFRKEPDFQERIGRAAEAKKKALDALRARPAVDPEVLAQARAAHEARKAAQAEAHAEKKAAQLALKQAKIAEAAEKVKPAYKPTLPTEAERKAARDARYAARKSRK